LTTEHVGYRPGPLTRIVDRVKRPLFLVCFLAALAGVITWQVLLFFVGTVGFCVVILLHLFMRRSETPLLGNYLGMGRYLRVTREGKILLALTLVIGLTAIQARINLLLIVLGMLLGAVLISGVLSENALRRLSVRLFLPSTAFAGTPFPARLTLRNGKKRLPSYSVHVEIHFEGTSETLASRSYVLKLPANRAVTLEHMLDIPTRGRWTVRRIRVATLFPFGFFEKWSYHAVDAEILLFPRLGHIPGRLIPTSDEYRHQGATKVLSKVGHDEFWGVREYRDGDNPRLIHWRTSARLGKRLVKEYHRQESQNVCILLDTHVPEDRGDLARRFESAVSFTATLTKQLLDQDYRVSFAAYGQDLVRLSTDGGQRQARRILTALAEIEPSRDRDFEDVVRELDPRVMTDTFVVAVLLDAARERTVRAKLQRGRRNRMRLVSVDSPAFRAVFNDPTGNGTS